MNDHHRKLESMYSGAPIQQFFKSTIYIEEAAATISLHIKPDYHHAFASVHGSVYFKMLDDAAYSAANSVVEDWCIVTVSFSIQMLRPASSGALKAEGQLVNNAGRILVAESQITDDNGHLIAIGHGTFARSGVRLSDVPAYSS